MQKLENRDDQKAWILRNWNVMNKEKRSEALKRFWVTGKKKDVVDIAREIFEV